jgi:hypothetical protein
MLKKHPHTATIKWYSDPVVDEFTGTYTEGDIEEETVKCRVVPTNEIYTANGGITKFTYGYTVYLPKLDFVIPPKANFIYNGVEMDISRVDVFQRNVVIWL